MPLTQEIQTEITRFTEPLVLTMSSEEDMRTFLRGFGYAPPGGFHGSLSVKIAALETAFMTFAAAGPSAATAPPLFNALADLCEDNGLRAVTRNGADFLVEVFDALLDLYLSRYHGVVFGLLVVTGVRTSQRVAAGDPGGRDIDYTRIRLDWARLADFIADNGKWAGDVYGWGVDFNHLLAIQNLVVFLQAGLFGLSRVRKIVPPELDAFVSASGGHYLKAELPLLQDDHSGFEADGTPTFATEAGIKVIPSGNGTEPDKMGLAIVPYAKGNVAVPVELSTDLTLKVTAGAEGPFLKITPDGVSVGGPPVAGAMFEFSLRKANPDGTPLILAEAGKSRVQALALVGTLGGDLGGDLFVAGGVEKLQAVIDLSKDGLLGALVTEPITLDVGTLILGWRHGRGVYFEGGANIEVTVPLNLELGPVNLSEVRVGLDLTEGCGVRLLVTGDATIGPVFAALENTGVVMRLSKNETGRGMLGFYDPSFEFVPPSGYALALDAAPIEGGGYLSVEDDEYRGALALQFESIGFSAFAILNTKLPGGEKGFSLAASIFASFNLPLGYGFFLTGLGGVIGINRTVHIEALREVLFGGRMDNLLFPADPIANARTILADMAAILPPKDGQFVIGPVARISFGVPAILEAKLGVVIELGNEVRVLILGGLACYLPVKEAALVDLRLSFFGAIDFPAKALSFDATLQGSRILSFPVAGDAAIRSGWSARAEHLAAFGGWHPLFPKPDGMVSLRRLSINFGTNNPRVTLAAYMAVTMNSVQFGARADLYAKGPDIWLVGQCAAEGLAYFDALIYFNPFQFDVSLGGGLSLLVDGEVAAGLGFALRLRGPNPFHLRGDVWVEVCGVEVRFGVEHQWGTVQALPPAVMTRAAVRDSIMKTARLETVPTTVRTSGVTFREGDDVKSAIDPVGGLRWVQRIAPLNVALEKIGDSKLDGFKTLSVELNNGVPYQEDFVRGHFFELSESERLRAPGYEPHDAGFELGSQEWVASAGAQTLDYGYEIIAVADDPAASLKLIKNHVLKSDLAQNAIRFTHNARFRPAGLDYKRVNPPSQPVKLKENRFVAAADTAKTISTTIRRGKGVGLNPSVAAYIASTQ